MTEAIRSAIRSSRNGNRPYLVDGVVALAFLLLAYWVGHGLWPDPATRELAVNPNDQILIEWFLAVDTRVLLAEHGFVTDRLNAPGGVNLLANASSLGLGFLLAPVTLLFGAPVSFAVLTIGNLAGTAVAWYLLFTRTFRTHPAVAAGAGFLCGFSPAMISQSNSHWHITAQWLVPAIVWSVVRLARAATAGDGRQLLTFSLWLAGLAVAQFFIGAEILYLTAVTLALFTLAYAALRPRWAWQVLPGFAAGLAVALGVATMLLAHPLWVMMAGPGSVPNGPFPASYFSANLASWPAFSSLTVAGTAEPGHLTTGAEEYNTFLGWPLLLVAAGCLVWLSTTSRQHRPAALAAAAAAAVMAVLSLGPELVVGDTRTGVPLPYLLLVDAPVVDAALPQRYALAVVPLIALVLVLTLQHARTRTGVVPLASAAAAVTFALVPLFPLPLPTAEREPVPVFFTDGHWRECVPPGGVLVPVPLPTPGQPEPMRWAAAANAQFGLPEGFFIGPYGAGGRASMGIWKQPTSKLLADVAATGEVPPIGPPQRARAAADLAHWGADCVVLDPDHPHGPALRTTLEDLLGPGQPIADVWTWQIHS